MKRQKVDSAQFALVQFNNNNVGKPDISPDNAFTLLTQAMIADDAGLAANCWFTIDNMPLEAFRSAAFQNIHLDLLCYTLKRNTLRIREVDVFKAVVSWSRAECHRKRISDIPANRRQVIGRALNYVRFPLMSLKEFKSDIFKTGILTEKELDPLFKYFFAYYQKPPVAFPTDLRLPSELIVNRFRGMSQRESRAANRIAFSVDQPIILIGFGLYGRYQLSQDYTVRIQIKKWDRSSEDLLVSNMKDVKCDGTNNPFRVLFKTPVVIQARTQYIACAKLVVKGQPFYLYENIGVRGQEKVEVRDRTSGVKVEFTFSDLSNTSYTYTCLDETNVVSGQIPQLIFYPSVVDVKTLS